MALISRHVCFSFATTSPTVRLFFQPNTFGLSLEEQFYLTWPALLLLLGRRRAAWLFRVTHRAAYTADWPSFRTEVRADAICVGCLLAILLADSSFRSKMTQWLPKLYPVALATVPVCVYFAHSLPPLPEPIAFAVLISGAILQPSHLFTRCLEFTPLVWLGTISYSLYVWHIFFFSNYGIASNLLLDCLLPCVVLMSYYLIEKPFTALGRRVTSGQRKSHLQSTITSPSGRCEDTGGD
jgi:peptidoglycan/LPS O-acetylase OafA/YrhL